jgi:hypothetical protein
VGAENQHGETFEKGDRRSNEGHPRGRDLRSNRPAAFVLTIA